MHYINDVESVNEFKEYLKEEGLELPKIDSNVVKLANGEEFHISPEVSHLLVDDNKALIFGKDDTQGVVAAELHDPYLRLFIENKDGTITTKDVPNTYWMLASKQYNPKFERLEGDLHYKWIRKYTDLESYKKGRNASFKLDTYQVWDSVEASLIYNGITFFKGLKVEDVSVLAFDIESEGLVHYEGSRVYMIANTFKKLGKIERKLFTIKDYDSDKEMIEAWCDWVREKDPSVMLGHNIMGYDFPYLKHCADMVGAKLNLGRDGSEIRFAERESKFRKDASQFYTYKKVYIYGRQSVDTFFLAIKYDIGRKYISYNLKQIIKQEGLEVEGRQFYDASKIKDNFENPEEWKRICDYCIFDGDDAITLYNLMGPSFFYMTQSVPRSFESLMVTASGSQINSVLVRAYLQDNHSIPKATPVGDFQGAISFGNPGIWKSVYKVDANNLYPSCIRQYKIYDEKKDPKAYFLTMVEYFAIERLRNKKLAKETGDRYYDDLQNSQKTFANSMYGFLSAEGLSFNSPIKAAYVTEKGREVLKTAIKWATSQDFVDKVEEDDLEEKE